VDQAHSKRTPQPRSAGYGQPHHRHCGGYGHIRDAAANLSARARLADGNGRLGSAGLLCLLAPSATAELACTLPRTGGDYIYQTRAYGPGIGFSVAWGATGVILPANIGMMALRLFGLRVEARRFFSRRSGVCSGRCAYLTASTFCGFVLGRRTQNGLTVAKVLG